MDMDTRKAPPRRGPARDEQALSTYSGELRALGYEACLSELDAYLRGVDLGVPKAE